MLGVNVRVDVRGQEKKKEEDEEEEAGDWPRAAGRVVSGAGTGPTGRAGVYGGGHLRNCQVVAAAAAATFDQIEVSL